MSKSAQELTRRELYTQVWSRPMRDLAKEFGISDVALKKTCTRHNIPTPERGYWAKKAAGKAVKPTPLPDPRPNAPAVITVGGWTNPYLPESLARTSAAIKRETFETVDVEIRPAGDYQHPLVLDTARQLEKTKANEQGWIVPPHGVLNVRVSRAQLARALSIVDALFRAAENQGWQPTVEFRVPRRRSVVGTFWYPGVGWTQQLPTPRRAEMGMPSERDGASRSQSGLPDLADSTDSATADLRTKPVYPGSPEPLETPAPSVHGSAASRATPAPCESSTRR